MLNRKTQNVEKIRNLKHLISKKYKLSENTIISIAELSCHEPDCPPIETVITARNDDGTMKQVALSTLKTYLTSAGFSSEDPTALAIALG